MTETAAGALVGRKEKSEGVWGYLVLLGLVRLALSWAAGETGLRALSDDDYARATIAERFAEHPAFDPSGTSWLPFPFWLTGGAMRLLDTSLDVTRVVASFVSIGATWLVFATARTWGFGERQAFRVALAVSALPVVAVLGSVAVPELPTAALSAYALVAASTGTSAGVGKVPFVEAIRSGLRSPFVRAGAAMFAATLSRYEAWPLALVVGVYSFLRAAGPRSKRMVLAALPLVGPLGWIVHNRWAHGDALSFVRRVAGYRAALGATAGAGEMPLGAVGGLVSGAPAVAFCVAAFVVLRFRTGDRAEAGAALGRLRPLAIGSAALLVFLEVGELVGGAPTHHPERALLVVWLLAMLALFDLTTSWRPPLWVAPVVLGLLALDYRQALADRGVDRRSEEQIGVQLRSLVARGERVFIATNDYGYFAIVAAFGRPSDTVVDKTHDPRVKDEASVVSDRWSAPERLRKERAKWLVAPSPIVFPMAFRERTRDSHLAIYELDAPR